MVERIGKARPIDVWDVETFDDELRQFLDANADVIRSYWLESRRLFDEREAQTLRGSHKENVHGGAYIDLKAAVTDMMDRRTIRAWHYTRLTAQEITRIRASGMQPMTLQLIRSRLDQAVREGHLDASTADHLYQASPYHRQTLGNREFRIWLTARPYPIDDSGVVELLEKWGGESIYFNHSEGPLADVLREVGTPCVIEVAMPLSATTRASCAAENVLDAWSFAIGCTGGWGGGSDIVAVVPIPPEWIIAVHSGDDATFATRADAYVAKFGI